MRLRIELRRFADTVEAAATPADVIKRLDDYCAPDGLRAFCVWAVQRVPSQQLDSLVLDKTIFLQADVPPQYLHDYKACVRKHGVPRTAFYARASGRPFTLLEVRRVLRPSVTEQWWWDDVHLRYMTDGLYCPQHRNYSVLFSSPRTVLKLSEPKLLTLATMASLVALRFDRLIPFKPAVLVPKLGGRQLEALRLMSKDLDTNEIAAEMRVKKSSVDTHLERAKKALGTKTYTGAVAKAKDFGLI